MHNVRTFRVYSPERFLVPLVVLSVLILGIIYMISDEDVRGLTMLLLGGTLLFSGILSYWLMTRTRLDISPEGITYHAIGYKVHSTWSNIIGCEKRVHGAFEPESLILREPGLEMSGWLGAGYKAMPFMNAVSLVGEGRVRSTNLSRFADNIPVGIFDSDWRFGEIGSLIRLYAPQVFASQSVESEAARSLVR